ncbi:MAG: arginase [Armatimonadetes bacterium]|nr:arginase [Armatimonadota bacterium]
MVELVGYPVDLGGPLRGSAMGPNALRYAGILNAFAPAASEVVDHKDLPLDSHPELPSTEGNFELFPTLIFDALKSLNQMVGSIVERGATPVTLGGDHSLTMASMGSYLKQHGPEGVGLLWIDAHADINTPDTSPSQNIHGMTIGSLLGLSTQQSADRWDIWKREFTGGHYLHPSHVSWIGLRDVDPGEAATIRSMDGAFVADMPTIDLNGIGRTFENWLQWAQDRKISKIWVSFDVDVLDPVLAPGTGTTVRGGLTYREAHLLAELLSNVIHGQNLNLVGLDIVEVSPLLDLKNETARMAVEWVGSLFGKKVMGPE